MVKTFKLTLSGSSEILMTRSQAKTLVRDLPFVEFLEIDFNNVKSIGPSFTDELFRVWPLNNPTVKIVTINANNDVLKMIKHIKGRTDLPQPG